MTPGFTVWRCTRCDVRLFPLRLLCSRCHGAEFAAHRITEGVVEEISIIRHMIGQADWKPRRIANVRTIDGPMLTVGLLDESEPGTAIDLFEEGAAPFGRAKA
ncbi:MAG: hypothetical protein IT536_01990 [Hyphomicrobiales bacterium]|nr:hypothetical protein [Hyphomicrobiales bacterium]